MDIYIKPAKKASLAERKTVYIKDIAEVIATKDVTEKVKNMKLLDIQAVTKQNYLISVTDIVKIIKKSYPDYSVNNLGEMDTFLEYSPVKSKNNAAIKWMKIVAVVLILLTGSATAIISFYSDAQLSKVFQQYYFMFFGKRSTRPMIIEIPYAIGLSVGIVVFFNHFLGKKVTADPTPIEVEMSMYEGQVSDMVIDSLNTERIRQTMNNVQEVNNTKEVNNAKGVNNGNDNP